jgi:hypothetical protein
MKAPFNRVFASLALAGFALTGSRMAMAELPELALTERFEPTAQELAADPDEHILFGNGVAIDGHTAMVGAPAMGASGNGGVVAVYQRSQSGTWSRIQTLTAVDPADDFGLAVTLKGNTALVRASNAVYVFRRTAGTWSQTAKLVGSGDILNFGFSGSIKYHSGRVTVGANFANGPSTIYVFTLNDAGEVASQTQIFPSDAAPAYAFGQYVDLDDNTIVAGAPGMDGAGAVYVFQRSGNAWTQTQKLVRPEPDQSRWFGIAVALNRNVLLVGDHSAQPEGAGAGGPPTSDGHSASGAVYVFRPLNGSYTYHTRLRPSPDQYFEYIGFGASLATDGDRAVINAYEPNTNGLTSNGVSFVYERDEDDAVATHIARVGGLEPIALSGNRLLLGAPYYFDPDEASFDSIGWAGLFTLPPVSSH